MVALIVGASGLVGSFAIQGILESERYGRVISVGRKKLNLNHPKLVQIQTELSDLDLHASEMKADDYFCCLGTTIKSAGSQENFKKVDYDAPIKLARIAAAHGASQFLIVSAMGANPNSPIFYNRIKGSLEAELKEFDIPSIKIFRPSLLTGHRKELRIGEKMFQAMEYLPIWFGPLLKYKPIPAEKVARCMLKMAEKNDPGYLIIQSDFIQNC